MRKWGLVELVKTKRELLSKAEAYLKAYTPSVNQETIFYITTCSVNKRGDVWRTSGATFEKAWKKVLRYLDKFPKLPKWTKIDIQTNTETLPVSECLRRFARTRRNNYFPQGVAFKKDGSCSFLPEEISANALLTPVKGHKLGVNSARLQLNPNNLKGYIKRRFKRIIPNPLAYFDDEWDLFDTAGIFIDNGEIFTLETEFFGGGMRKITVDGKDNALEMAIEQGMDYLFEQINADGSFVYGYYPAYHKILPGYNSVRHFSSLYALLETIEYSKLNDRSLTYDTLLSKIDKGIEWGLTHLCIAINETIFVAEKLKNGSELKLGAQAVAILTLAKYESLTGDDFYHQIMLNLLEGIKAFIDEKGRTVHVLSEYLSVKEDFRIIYYDGEALFAIMRAYPLTGDDYWLNLGERLMDQFVKSGYERYHDHWLSYSVNELTHYLPKRSYFEFGVKNALQNLSFMENRDTAYPTFLELLCAANKMFNRIDDSEFAGMLFSENDFQRLREVTEKRMLHELRTGVMWPEYAMFFARPETIVHGFYARHDRTRMRIDDAEHFLSGLINYTYLFNHEGSLTNEKNEM